MRWATPYRRCKPDRRIAARCTTVRMPVTANGGPIRGEHHELTAVTADVQRVGDRPRLRQSVQVRVQLGPEGYPVILKTKAGGRPVLEVSCKRTAMPAVAITDTGNLFGALEFSQYCVGKGVQPIIGCQISLARAGKAGAGARSGGAAGAECGGAGEPADAVLGGVSGKRSGGAAARFRAGGGTGRGGVSADRRHAGADRAPAGGGAGGGCGVSCWRR